MSTKPLQPLKGFEDRYPEDKALDDYIFSIVKSVAASFGFQQYDGPLVEPIELYEGKTSRELLEEQAFTLKDRNDKTLMLRPEMTPSLARMVAARSQELTLPIRWFNIGLRYRYEAPQKGRNREFYQMDFDIIGSDSMLADVEILAVVVEIYRRFGATPKDVVVYLNSRQILNDVLQEFDIPAELSKEVIFVIDRKEKVSSEKFEVMLEETGLRKEQVQKIINLFNNPEVYVQYFAEIMSLAETYGIADFIEVNPTIVRGLDYYTGIVFEVKSRSQMGRSLLGGGRYDNLVGMFGTKDQIPGIGFAISDTITKEFLKDAEFLLPTYMQPSTVLVTVFSEELQEQSIKIAQQLREGGIATELYPAYAKLQKQLKYADKKNISYVIVVGPDEAASNAIKCKNMKTGDEQSLSVDEVIHQIVSRS